MFVVGLSWWFSFVHMTILLVGRSFFLFCLFFFFFKQKTAYEMRISDWSSDVCSSDLPVYVVKAQIHAGGRGKGGGVKVVKSLDDVKAEATRMRSEERRVGKE